MDVEFPSPIATVDAVLLTLHGDALAVALLRRDREPFANRLALPGGFVHAQDDRTLEDAAARVLRTKAGIAVRYLEQLGTFSGIDRDPRGWSLSVAYVALVPHGSLDAAGPLEVHPTGALPPLAFDHARIVAAAVDRVRGKSSYFALPAFLLPPAFTMAELHAVYERVLGVRLDRASFRRKVESQDIVEPAEGERRVGAHRPATLYRLRRGPPKPFLYRI